MKAIAQPRGTTADSHLTRTVASVFSSVASSYDTMNDLMSLGIHRLWKDHFVRGLNPGIRPNTSSSRDPSAPREQQRILDIAGGTGDIAMRMLDHATTLNRDTTAHVTVSDINPEMLAEGRKRLSQTPYAAAGRVDFLEANAESLPTIPDASIDLYTVAFGIRNFTHKDAALREAYRVLKPGGVFACLEFAPNLNNPLFNAVYKRWSFSAIPLIGQVVAADRDSYQYLVESIERFPKQSDFAQMIREAGFVVPGQGREGAQSEGVGKEGWEDLSFGIAAIHKGVKPL
jgi:2-methoxy-6-polyprenyl-1,4-benzoquinol methylase